jgi:hypothetical protein
MLLLCLQLPPSEFWVETKETLVLEEAADPVKSEHADDHKGGNLLAHEPVDDADGSDLPAHESVNDFDEGDSTLAAPSGRIVVAEIRCNGVRESRFRYGFKPRYRIGVSSSTTPTQYTEWGKVRGLAWSDGFTLYVECSSICELYR